MLLVSFFYAMVMDYGFSLLLLFVRYAESDGGVLKNSAGEETGLVLIKPDNLQRASSLPGHIIGEWIIFIYLFSFIEFTLFFFFQIYLGPLDCRS